MPVSHVPIVLRVSAPVLLSLVAVSATAQGGGESRERGSLYFGAFVTNRDTTTRLDSGSGIGTNINLESDLGLDSALTVFRGGGDLWFGDSRRHRVDASVFDLSRSATRRIDRTIRYGEEVFNIDTEIHTENDLSIFKVDYTYALLDRDRGYLGLTGGLYVASVKLGLSEATLGTAESDSLTAPLPVVGFRGEYDLTDRWALTLVSEWFSINTGDVSGRLNDTYLAADYRLGAGWRFGLAYNAVNMSIDAKESSGFSGSLDWGYDGWLAYFKVDFGR